MSDLKNDILSKIKKGEIKKTSKWYFLTKKYLFWTFFSLSIFLGALSFSIFLKNILDDFGPWYKLKLENNFIYSNIYYFWIIVIILFLLSAYLNYKNTKNSFKYKNISVILFSIILSFSLGLVFYYTSLNNWTEQKIEKHNKEYLEIKKVKKEKIIKFLEDHNINKNEFFKNKKVIKIMNKYGIEIDEVMKEIEGFDKEFDDWDKIIDELEKVKF